MFQPKYCLRVAKHTIHLYIFLFFLLSIHRLLPVHQNMDLETYESDLADYSLQDSPFYEASRPMIFDLSMSAVNSLMATNVASGSGKGTLMLKVSTTSHAADTNSMSTNYATSSTNGRNETTSMRFDMSHRHGIIGIPNGNNSHRTAPVPLELTANTSSTLSAPMPANGPEPTKKKRKCVSFLPNYVQVNIPLQFILFIQLNLYLSLARLSIIFLLRQRHCQSITNLLRVNSGYEQNKNALKARIKTFRFISLCNHKKININK